MDLIYDLAESILKTRYENLPQEVVEVTKKQILDSFAVAVAGSSAPGVGELVEIFRDFGGKEETTVWVYGNRFPSIAAAQINATMVHARDFDDTHDPAVLHPSVVAIPAAFAVAERLGKISGKEIITAAALGIDLSSRLCLACTSDYFAGGWHFTPLHGSFSAAAVAGKLMGLDLKKLINAFGIAYHQTGGNLQCVDDGAMTKRCGPGFASRNGILACLMAEKGITGATNVLQGGRGLFYQYHRGAYKPEVVTKNLGKVFEGVNVSFKPYPCCRYNHPGIDAVKIIMSKNKIQAQDVESVHAHVGSTAWGLLVGPIEIKRNPRNGVDAQFSLPWALGTTVMHGRFTVGDISDEATKEKSVIAMSNKVSVVLEKELCLPGIEAVIVDIKTKNGKTYSHRVDASYGSPANPMTFDALANKLKDAVPFGAKKVSAEKVDKLVQSVADLEKIGDVRQVVSLLA